MRNLIQKPLMAINLEPRSGMAINFWATTGRYIGYKKNIRLNIGFLICSRGLSGVLNIESEHCRDPYLGLRIVEVKFRPYIKCVGFEVISLAVMRLLIKYVYHPGLSYGKFTLGYGMKIPNGDDVSYTVGSAISLNDSHGRPIPNTGVYAQIELLARQKAEDYDKEVLSGLFLRVYYEGRLEKEPPLSDEEITSKLMELIHSGGVGGGEPQEVKDMSVKEHRYPGHIPALKPTSKERQPFIVADTETVLVQNVHVPYAVGFLVVGEPFIRTYFSEDYYLFLPEFEERSHYMLTQFIDNLTLAAEKWKIRTVYFHNFSRFDGILLMKHYASSDNKYTIKPLMRNQMVYELSVYRGKKLVLRFRDSLNLLPGSLDTLAKTLCPQLGPKGSISHEKVQVSNLKTLRPQLVPYLEQDIRLLGGVMLKAQEIYWTQFKIDITTCLTLSRLALSIFRMRYYDPKSWPIHIPSRNEDTFIRRGYYGGHADVYIPYGKNLYYYDVNSLYPYIMKTCNMPGGVPVWHGDLEGQELSNLYGFIEAYVVCPRTITRPFLPYRDHYNTLLFPTGKFVGVYYSEELKFARYLGYTIIPLRGYLFEERASPFDSFVSTLFSKRQEAKRNGDDAMAYVYKILMNSLYGRFGINPESNVTEVCCRARYDELIRRTKFTAAYKLSDHYYFVSYLINTANVSNSDWNPPKISAVQLSAAISACARIHMYKYISREDCYYTDTDSAILGSPLPEDEISSMELGKLKLENFVEDGGVFLAPKAYLLQKETGDIIKHKGPAKNVVTAEWFLSQLADVSRIQEVLVESPFRIDWTTLNIIKKDTLVKLGIKVDTKRDPIFNKDEIWVATQPKDIVDYGDQESTIIKFELKFQRDEIHRLKSELTKSKEHLDKSASIQELLLIALLACFICWMAWLAIDYSPVGAKLEHCYELLKFQRDEIHSLKSELTKSKEHFIKMTQELRDQMKQERIDGLSKMIDDQAKITVDFNARIIEEIQRQNKLIQNKDAQLDDLREMNASLIKNNEEIDRLEAKLGKTTKLPTHKPKEPSWWKEKE